MTYQARRLLLTLVLAALPVENGFGQTPGQTSPFDTPVEQAPAPAPPSASPYKWPSPTIGNPYPTISLPTGCAPTACALHEDNNGRLLRNDPLLDSSPWACGTGLFGALEIDPVGPAVKNRLSAPVTAGGVTTTVQLPGANLHWTVMPRAEVGYRLGQGAGDLLISYRGLNAAGSGSLAGFDAAGAAAPLSSHLSMTVVDFDYASRENSLGEAWDMKWHAGVRVATIFFDSSAATPLLREHESNNFTGAGPHFAVDLKRRLGGTGLAMIAQMDGGVVLGSVHQLYESTIAGVGGLTRLAQTEPAPVLDVRFGLAWAPAQLPNLHLSTGYLFERWWTVGETVGTQGEVTVQGIFLRGEWLY